MAQNALAAGFDPNSFGLVGPTVDDDLRRAITRYGADAVREAAKRLTKKRQGRKKLPDWSELRPFIEADAAAWLEGRDPFSELSNYAIAKQIADANRGHDHASTMSRIQRKLRAKSHGRRWFVFVTIWQKTESLHPFALHLRALEELAAMPGREPWNDLLATAQGKLNDYIRWHGEPDPKLTMAEVVEGATPRNVLASLAANGSGGLLSFLSNNGSH